MAIFLQYKGWRLWWQSCVVTVQGLEAMLIKLWFCTTRVGDYGGKAVLLQNRGWRAMLAKLYYYSTGFGGYGDNAVVLQYMGSRLWW